MVSSLPGRAESAPDDDDAVPRYRSGAVARMLRMPVATLRIWEQRYRVSTAPTSASGHRLYSAEDVRRLTLVKQLTGLGHAIGTIAGMDVATLHQVAATHARALGPPAVAPPPGAVVAAPRRGPARLFVVGAALLRRLQQPGPLRAGAARFARIGAADDLAQPLSPPADGPPDLLLLQIAGLHAGTLAAVQAAAGALGASRVAVLYGFAPLAVCAALRRAGIMLQRDTLDDATLAVWLAALAGDAAAPTSPAPAPGQRAPDLVPDLMRLAQVPLPARRYDDATLADMAARSSTIACECPRHVAELLMQLSQFEAYSADCADRSPADAATHAYLQQVAAASRALFEGALERLALHEGLLLASR